MKVVASSGAYNVTFDAFGKIPSSRDDPQTYCSDTIRYVRRKQGKTQAEVAKKAGITASHLSRMEHGEWQSIRTMAKVYHALGLTFEISFSPTTTEEKEVA